MRSNRSWITLATWGVVRRLTPLSRKGCGTLGGRTTFIGSPCIKGKAYEDYKKQLYMEASMDLLKLIKEKTEFFTTSKDDIGISNVVAHIEVAEKHFEGGKAGDDYLFNDVVYRSNQAFEGVLKEAYRIIERKDPNDLTPHKIEKYFEENNILKERVLQLFSNYRTEWRNKSTHDYNLYFSEQEALLAVVSISAFVNILLDQMIEKKSYDEETTNIKSGTFHVIDVQNTESLVIRVTELMVLFSKEIPNILIGSASPRLMESALMGAMIAFLNNYASDIKVDSQYLITFGIPLRKYYIDLLLELDDEKVIIEVKNTLRKPSDVFRGGIDQLFNYLFGTGIKNGILYIPPQNASVEMNVSSVERIYENENYTVFLVYPIT